VAASAAFAALASLVVAPGQAQAATGYNALAGSRLYDSRTVSAFANGETRSLIVAGAGGVPLAATAVVLNVTAVTPTAAGYLTVWPTGQTQPGTSNVNFKPGDTVPNAVVVQLGTGGSIDIRNVGGTTQVLVDVTGYFEGGFIGVSPTRLLDTRSSAPTANDHVVQVAGAAGIPASGVAGVMLNVTVVSPTQAGFTTVHPDGSAQPNASNLNFVGGDVVANAVGIGLGANGSIRVSHESVGVAHYLVDVFGYFPTGSFVAVEPTRVFDTRKGASGKGLIRDGESFVVAVAGVAGVPTSGVGAVLANITVTGPTRGGYVSVWPNGVAQPNTSVLNFSTNQTKPNLTVLTLGNAGAVNVFVSSGSSQVLIDVLGYFPGTTSTAGAVAPPLPVPTITNPSLNQWNVFRSVGRTCASGPYAAAVPLKADDTLQTIAQNHSNFMAAAQTTAGILDSTIEGSDYRGVTPNRFAWFVYSGSATSNISDALTALATATADSCAAIYRTNIDAGVAVATSTTGRKFYTFLLNTPSYAATFTPTSVPGAIVFE
jgi:hypothetical protein